VAVAVFAGVVGATLILACQRVKMVSSGCNVTMVTAPDIQPAHTSTIHSLLWSLYQDVKEDSAMVKGWNETHVFHILRNLS
jgi:hypothetical protein